MLINPGNTNYITQSEKQLKISDNYGFSGGDFAICDQNGQQIMRVESKVTLSLTNSATRIYGMNGNLLATSKHAGAFKSYYNIMGADEQEVAQFKIVGGCPVKYKVIGMDGTDLLHIRCEQRSCCSGVYLVRNPAQEVVAKWDDTSSHMELQIAQGMDSLFIVAIAVTLLRMNNEQSSSNHDWYHQDTNTEEWFTPD